MDSNATVWREALLEAVAPHRDLPLLLSGGMDSCTLLAAQLALGAKPDCYSFRIGAEDSQDVRAAREVAQRFSLRFVVVTIPRTLAQLERDVREVMERLGTSRKSAVQCAHPLMHLARAVAADDYDAALVGTGGVVEDNRKLCVLVASEGEEAARAYRRENLLQWGNTDNGTWAMHRIAFTEGVRLIEPFARAPLAEVGLAMDVAELNRPVQKGIAVRAFPEFYTPLGGGKYRHARRNAPLQMGSKLREWHDELLDSPLNRRGSRAVVAVYRDLRAERDAPRLL